MVAFSKSSNVVEDCNPSKLMGRLNCPTRTLLFKTFKSHQNPQDYLGLVEKVMGHKELIKLGLNDSGHLCYTTRAQYKAEMRLQNDVAHLMQSVTHKFSADVTAFQAQLNDEQKIALDYIIHGPDLSVVIGRPGTGKSYLLKPVKQYYEAQNCKLNLQFCAS